MPGLPDPATVIRQQYPGWTIWVSDTRRWWAFRKVELTGIPLRLLSSRSVSRR